MLMQSAFMKRSKHRTSVRPPGQDIVYHHSIILCDLSLGVGVGQPCRLLSTSGVATEAC